VVTSRDLLHELYQVSMEEGVELESYVSGLAALTAISNLRFLNTTSAIDIFAAS
jgi:hypothetical protein